MTDDARFVVFLASERGRLHGYSLAAVGLALLAGASLLTVAWGRHEALLAAGILAALIVAVTGVTRYYRREFGRVKPVASDHKATMITALNACQEADITFLGGITGLGYTQASSWVDALRRTGLVLVDEDRHGATRNFVRLSTDGHDVARRLWD